MCVGALLLATPACSKILGIEDFSLGIDAGPMDAPAPDAQLCFGAGLAPVCLSSAPLGARTIDVALDTSMATTCTEVIAQTAMGAPDLCVIAANTITVSSTVTATGSRPLMLLATDTITIGGTLDVSSKRSPARVGAGANAMECGAGTAPVNNTNGAGGGAGGTFGSKGGNGGDGNLVNNNGASPAVSAPTYVRGGCKGQDGGDAGTVQGGTGGAGGGAVYLYAGTSIEIAGNIFASGAGAGATGLHAGGGGGGSGGVIGLEAPTITVDGIVAANGGNASAGSGTSTVGGAGVDGATTSYNTQPAPTTNGSSGGSGGRGATGATLASNGNPGASGAAGGGGGGGFGVIWVKGSFTGTMVSPAVTQN